MKAYLITVVCLAVAWVSAMESGIKPGLVVQEELQSIVDGLAQGGMK